MLVVIKNPDTTRNTSALSNPPGTLARPIANKICASTAISRNPSSSGRVTATGSGVSLDLGTMGTAQVHSKKGGENSGSLKQQEWRCCNGSTGLKLPRPSAGTGLTRVPEVNDSAKRSPPHVMACAFWPVRRMAVTLTGLVENLPGDASESIRWRDSEWWRTRPSSSFRSSGSHLALRSGSGHQ